MRQQITNIITVSRMVAALLMLTTSPASAPYWALYAWCGISDMIDGPISRALRTQSRFGSRLDSASDLVFSLVCLITLLPVFPMPIWLIGWIALIALCKIASYASGLMMRGKLVTLHTIANKAAGFLLFASIPVVVLTHNPLLTIPACIVSTFAAIQEGHLVRTGAPAAE